MSTFTRSAPLVVSLVGAVAACGGAAPPAPIVSSGAPLSNTAPERPSIWDHPPGEPAAFLFVDNFDYGVAVDGAPTYSGRRYAISLNVAIPDHDRLRPALAWRLDAAGVAGVVAVEPFGEEALAHLEIHAGDLVPVAVTQAVLEVYGRHAGLPVRLGASRQDQGFGERTRVYVGSFVHSIDEVLTGARLDELLAPGLSPEAFYGLMPEVPARATDGSGLDGVDALQGGMGVP